MTIDRKEFLKLSAMLAASTVMRPVIQMFPARRSADPDAKNILFVVFDTLSAKNINFYGYQRETMPHLTRLLDRATVYHNHYANANFTTPGTASLLTGRHTWEHLAIRLSMPVEEKFTEKSIFSYFDDYYRLAYSHNPFADTLLSQFDQALSIHQEIKNLFLKNQQSSLSQWFDGLMAEDPDTAQLFQTRLSDPSLDGYQYSLIFLSLLNRIEYEPPAAISAQFPRGVPSIDGGDYFLLEDAVDWFINQAAVISQPFLTYLHFLPPHYPFNTRAEFVDTFSQDGFQPIEKSHNPVALPSTLVTNEEENDLRLLYDEFILYADSEFDRLFSALDQQGILDNTLVVFTSDHGEEIERRTFGHLVPYLYDPVTKIPLIIFEPGQTERRDIRTLTSCIDLLPTLLHYTGREVPEDLPGQILPPFAEPAPTDGRTIYALYARENDDSARLSTATLMLRRDNFKVIRYTGYSTYKRNINTAKEFNIPLDRTDPYYEVFDLEADPEELTNLARNPAREIQQLIDEIDLVYQEQVEFSQTGAENNKKKI